MYKILKYFKGLPNVYSLFTANLCYFKVTITVLQSFLCTKKNYSVQVITV